MKKAKKGRRELPHDEKKTQIQFCVQNKYIDALGGKEAVQELALTSVIRSGNKIIKK